MAPIRSWATVIVAGLLTACVPTHEKLRRELDQLRLREGYVLLSERAAGVYPPFFGDTLRVERRYRSPHGMEETCEDIRLAGEAFSTRQAVFHPRRETELTSVCSVGFARKRFGGGMVATSPSKPDAPGSLRSDRQYVLVDAVLKAR